MTKGLCSFALLALILALICLASVGADNNRFCQNEFTNRFVANPRSCQHWIFCQNQVATREGQCQGIFYFDVAMQLCRYPIYVECQFDAVDVTCATLDFELHPHPENCGQYVACIEGFPRVINCAPNLHWNAERQECDLPGNAQCQIEQDVTYVCDPSRNYLTVHPHDCRAFLVCIAGTRSTNRCAEGLFFDPINLHCDLQQNVNCVNPGPGPGPEVQIECDPAREFYLTPHPTNCNAYFVCLSGSARPAQCASGLIFDWMSLQCNTADIAFCPAVAP